MGITYFKSTIYDYFFIIIIIIISYLFNFFNKKRIITNYYYSKKIINIEESTYNYFMSEAEFRCRTLVSLIRYSINALYEKDFLL